MNRTDTTPIPAPWLMPPATATYRPWRLDLAGRLTESLRAARVTVALFGAAGLGFAASVLTDTLGAAL